MSMEMKCWDCKTKFKFNKTDFIKDINQREKTISRQTKPYTRNLGLFQGVEYRAERTYIIEIIEYEETYIKCPACESETIIKQKDIGSLGIKKETEDLDECEAYGPNSPRFVDGTHQATMWDY